MNGEATVSAMTTSVGVETRVDRRFSTTCDDQPLREKLNDLALKGFTSPEPVIMADFDLTCYQRYTCLCGRMR